MRAARLAAAALLMGFCFASAASCADVLDLGGYQSAPIAMCDLLDRCYGRAGFRACLAHMEARLASASDESRERWLKSFSENSCLTDCTSAWLCLDLAPVCEPLQDGCAEDEQCCGFTTGLSGCAAGRCCVPDGVPCSGDGDCCEGSCDSRSHTCGGVVCAASAASCVNHFECCTQICDPITSRCSETVCAADGFPCQQGFECCSNFCDATGQCAPALCAPEGTVCGGDEDCCTLYCSDELGVCSSGECTPDNLDCAFDEDCCSSYCDPDFGKCGDPLVCLEDGEECVFAFDCCTTYCDPSQRCACVPSGGACGEGSQCCEGGCSDGVCDTLQCAAPLDSCRIARDCCSGRCETIDDLGNDRTCCIASECAHDTCTVGPALDPLKCRSDCVATICIGDPYCCCVAWDQSCVDRASDPANDFCAESCPPP